MTRASHFKPLKPHTINRLALNRVPLELAKTEALEKVSTAEHELAEYSSEITRLEAALEPVSYTHLTLPTTPYV